ncbi:MAG: DsbA family protein [Pseudomonadota bacterium]
MQPLETDAPLIVYIDVKSPYAFIAIEPTLALEQRLGTAFDWRGLTLDIPSYLGSARKKAGKVVASNRTQSQWSGVKYAYMDARRYAERQGHKLYGTEKIWDSSLASIAINWVMQNSRAHLGDFLQTIYPPFWRRELDIEDLAVVTSVLDQAGCKTSGFADYAQGAGRELHDQLNAQLHDAGIFGVPSYVFDDQILFGREHLPYVEWALGGRQGPAPDIAYPL